MKAALESMGERLLQERDSTRGKAVRLEERSLVTPYHLRRALVQGLAYDEQAYRQVSEATVNPSRWADVA